MIQISSQLLNLLVVKSSRWLEDYVFTDMVSGLGVTRNIDTLIKGSSIFPFGKVDLTALI
ncbi:hypothetical protein [cyanobacterium endosymbiont of Rhopalodia gibberula]|uniref:hypothetical protein n=1 Tax=cyanobacterium endosymbiont of Rhopalodia gibberula TaxID=1763363 RepID=UPI000E648090|nr:hypothetical protein [cyanobacterium endosymbiont of Rhopalodia gibberula]